MNSQNAIRHRAIGYLARREYSRQQLLSKLVAAGFAQNDSVSVIESLEKAGLQSDLRFAQQLVRRRKQGGYSPDWIVKELEHHGVASIIIESVVDRHSPDWAADIMVLLGRRFPDSSGTMFPQKARFLSGRGYTAEDIFRVLNREKTYDDDTKGCF